MEDLINPEFNKHGYIQVYTGLGKCKTTGSLGLAIRALGHGWNVLLVQFMKAENLWHYGEITSLLKHTSNIDIKQYGVSMVGKITKDDIDSLRRGWDESKDCILHGKYDLIVLDEINHVIHQNIIDFKDVVDTLKSKPVNLEVVLTGRYARPEIIEVADLVTEMTCVKHYFNKGVSAREGIEY